ALKNIGMGSGSRAGKMEMHCDGKPSVNQDLCIGCGACSKICAHDAPQIKDKKAAINHDKCVGCGRCLAVCPKDAIAADFGDSVAVLNYKMAEYSLAVCKDRPCFHISLICDVSPNCDCHSENDIPIIPNVGMLASSDPVALDQACADLCNKMEPVKDSILGENREKHHDDTEHDHFYMTHPDTEWKSCIAHAVKIGLGTDQYELVKI
ncbi:MAG TPA: 4Fe-4S ferredoxin, partial [Lachnospiraceae bacterium]|nr:4Fe-4S ferredoxin [Lachnospiraceae bacterium]